MLHGPLDQVRRDSKAMLALNVKKLMNDIISVPYDHARMLAGGQHRFRVAFARDLGVFHDGNRAQVDTLADSVWRFFEKTWEGRFTRQGLPVVSPSAWLDAYNPPSELTEAEVNGAWEMEIASSESYMREHYEGSARIRRGATPQELGIKQRG